MAKVSANEGQSGRIRNGAVARLGRWYQKDIWKWKKAGHGQGEGRAFPGAPDGRGRLLWTEVNRREISSYTVDGHVKWCGCSGKQFDSSSKTKM